MNIRSYKIKKKKEFLTLSSLVQPIRQFSVDCLPFRGKPAGLSSRK